MSELTHAELVRRAGGWLRNTRRCSVVALERNAWAASEAPDAIGWTYRGYSILIECKTSVADFRRDQRKPGRRTSWLGMGRERWYLAPAGILTGVQLPHGWGLLEAHGGRPLRAARRSEPRTSPLCHAQEVALLVAITRRALAGSGDGLLLIDDTIEVTGDLPDFSTGQ